MRSSVSPGLLWAMRRFKAAGTLGPSAAGVGTRGSRVTINLAVLVGQQQPDQARGVAALPGQGDQAQLQRRRAHQPRLVLQPAPPGAPATPRALTRRPLKIYANIKKNTEK